MRDFLEKVNSREILILDGGFGSLLDSLGGSMKSGDNNTGSPDIVKKAHQLYVDAGSEAITSNTFALNGAYAAKQDLSAEDTEKSLRAAMSIAVEVCGEDKYLLADLGPSGEMLPPLGQADPQLIAAGYRSQAKIMAEYAISAFIIETVFDLAEAEIILHACREVAPSVPIILSMTFSSLKRGGCTLMGNTAAKIAKFAAKNGVAVVGANCGDLSPADYAQIITSMKGNCDLPLLVQPNAGKPQLINKQAVYPLDPAEFASQMSACVEAGATLLGGCCGTTPQHIAAISQRFK